ncbi:MAG: hypothetical protein HY814_07095 [Candidatus Riflebacteria bacterium]|nr:hypothetical protein [Candidatus Riflebacteria bacterium]
MRGNQVAIHAARCKRRFCSECAPGRWARCKTVIEEIIRRGNGRWVRVDLTLNPHRFRGPRAAWGAIGGIREVFLRHLKRSCSELAVAGWHVAWVLEPHENVYPHLHLVFGGVDTLDENTVRECAMKAKAGRVTVVAQTEKVDPATYLAKGMSPKRLDSWTPQIQSWLAGPPLIRTFGHNLKGFRFSEPDPNWRWTRAHQTDMPRELAQLARVGYEVPAFIPDPDEP